MSEMNVDVDRRVGRLAALPTLSQFARKAGVKIVPAGRGWGGRYAYTSPDYPNCRSAGFKTRSEAYAAWATETFGAHSGRALIDLLTPN